MYHIVKTKSKKFQVVLVGENGEPLSTSEILNTKQSAFKNISAQAKIIETLWLICQDDTTTKVYKVYNDGKKEISKISSVPKYIPGNNEAAKRNEHNCGA